MPFTPHHHLVFFGLLCFRGSSISTVYVKPLHYLYMVERVVMHSKISSIPMEINYMNG